MTPLAAGYQHFADGAPFAEIALRHPAVREVYFPWVDEPSGRPKLGFEEEDDPEELAAALKRDLTLLRNAGNVTSAARSREISSTSSSQVSPLRSFRSS